MTNTNCTIPKKVYIFKNGVTDSFVVLKEFPYQIIVKSKSKNLDEAKLRLTDVVRNVVEANAALELHFDENLFGGSYVAKVALIGKPNTKPGSLNEREVADLVSSIMEKIQRFAGSQGTLKYLIFSGFAFLIFLLLLLVNYDEMSSAASAPNFLLKFFLEWFLANCVFLFFFNKWYSGKLSDPNFIYVYCKKSFIQIQQ